MSTQDEWQKFPKKNDDKDINVIDFNGHLIPITKFSDNETHIDHIDVHIDNRATKGEVILLAIQ